jgi:hypothetical protein
MSLVLNHEAVLAGWQHLETVLKTGSPAFPAVNGQSFFEHLASDSARSEAMARFMQGVYGHEGPRIAAGFPFNRFARIIDVGGAAGNILADILQVHPQLEGAVFDLPETSEVARQYLAARGMGRRTAVFAGDFLVSVTPDYDAYLIKSTLHDWDDDKAGRILSNICTAMPPHGRVLVIEVVFGPEKMIPPPHRFIDLEMMVTFGGRERSAEEYADLLHGAGLRLNQVHSIEGSVFSIMEASKRSGLP